MVESVICARCHEPVEAAFAVERDGQPMHGYCAMRLDVKRKKGSNMKFAQLLLAIILLPAVSALAQTPLDKSLPLDSACLLTSFNTRTNVMTLRCVKADDNLFRPRNAETIRIRYSDFEKWRVKHPALSHPEDALMFGDATHTSHEREDHRFTRQPSNKGFKQP